MIINQESISNLFTVYSAAFRQGFDLATPKWDQVAMMVPSSSRENQYPWLGVAPMLREWLGDRVAKSMEVHQYRIVNRKYESTIAVSRDDIEDDMFSIYQPLLQQMGNSAALHPDELVFGLLANGLTELGYDGLPMFSAAHPVDAAPGGVQSNLDSGGAGPYWYLADLSKPVKPVIFQVRRDYDFRMQNQLDNPRVFESDEYLFGVDARVNVGFGLWQQIFASNQALNETNFEAAWEAMQAFISDEGQPLASRPTHVIVPSNLEFDALRLLQPTLGSGSSNIHQGRVDVIVSQHLPVT